MIARSSTPRFPCWRISRRHLFPGADRLGAGQAATQMQPPPTLVPGRATFPTPKSPSGWPTSRRTPFGLPGTIAVPQLKLPKGSRSRSTPAGFRTRARCGSATRVPWFASNRLLDKVYAIVDRNGKREVKVIASGMDRPNGLPSTGTLYIAEGTRISKLENIETTSTNRASRS